jgi:hypothetical protein
MTTTAPYSTIAVAEELVALCRSGRNLEAIDRLYAADIASVEPASNGGVPAEVTGLGAVRAKNEGWFANNEIHAVEVTGPLVNGNHFAVQFTFDFTPKSTGRRITFAEMALYTVQDGKIVREQFFYQKP